MGMMTYKGYAARIDYSDEDESFIGRIAGIQDVVGFHGNSVAELKAAFEEAVEDYLATCSKLGRAPQKPFSGKFMLRVTPEIHAHAATMAEARGMSLNAWAAQALAQYR